MWRLFPWQKSPKKPKFLFFHASIVTCCDVFLERPYTGEQNALQDLVESRARLLLGFLPDEHFMLFWRQADSAIIYHVIIVPKEPLFALTRRVGPFVTHPAFLLKPLAEPARYELFLVLDGFLEYAFIAFFNGAIVYFRAFHETDLREQIQAAHEHFSISSAAARVHLRFCSAADTPPSQYAQSIIDEFGFAPVGKLPDTPPDAAFNFNPNTSWLEKLPFLSTLGGLVCGAAAAFALCLIPAVLWGLVALERTMEPVRAAGSGGEHEQSAQGELEATLDSAKIAKTPLSLARVMLVLNQSGIKVRRFAVNASGSTEGAGVGGVGGGGVGGVGGVGGGGVGGVGVGVGGVGGAESGANGANADAAAIFTIWSLDGKALRELGLMGEISMKNISREGDLWRAEFVFAPQD